MKKIFIVLILCVFANEINAQGVKFESNLSWEQIRLKAKVENKYIMVDAFATWCGPCKMMNESTFPKKLVGDFINDKFIAVQFQMDQTKYDDNLVKSRYADANTINQLYIITAYPTILFFSPNGELVHRIVGSWDENGLIKHAKDALDADRQFYTQYRLFEKGKSDTTFLKKLALQAEQISEKNIAKLIANRFIMNLDSTELFKKHNFLLVYQFTTSSKDKYFNIFQKQPRKANTILIKNAAEIKVRNIIAAEEIHPFIKIGEIPDWLGIEKRIRNKYHELGLEALYEERLAYAFEHKDWDDYGKYFTLYYTTALSRSRFGINAMAMIVFENITDKEVIDSAVNAMRYDIENFDQKDGYAYDTYANLLYKSGRKAEALEWQEKAVKLEPGQMQIKANYEKMKVSEPTW